MLFNYRLYFLDSTGGISGPLNFQSRNDLKAIAHARECASGKGWELWSGMRVLARNEPHAARTESNAITARAS